MKQDFININPYVTAKLKITLADFFFAFYSLGFVAE